MHFLIILEIWNLYFISFHKKLFEKIVLNSLSTVITHKSFIKLQPGVSKVSLDEYWYASNYAYALLSRGW